nr:hypothetical protein [uncultured Carboxylicivirga sp.]
MSKEKDTKINNKKAPEKTLKEKRLAKEAKPGKKTKKAKSNSGISLTLWVNSL